MFIIRKLVFALVLLVAVFLGASVVLESFAETQLSSGIAKTLDLGSRPNVEIDAFPIILRVMQGRIPRIVIDAHNVTIQKLDVQELSIELKGVHANLDVLIRSNQFDLKVEHGVATATVTEDATNAYLKAQGENAHVTFRPDGSVFVRSDRVVAGKSHRFEATGTLAVEARTLTFTPTKVTVDGGTPPPGLAALARRETTISVRIPKLPGNILPSKVVPSDAQVSLIAALENYQLQLNR